MLRAVGEPPTFDFEPKDHLDLGVALDLIDMERAAKASGSRFAYLKGDLVLLQFALVRFGLDDRRREGVPPGRPAGPRARRGHVRHRLLPRRRAADLPARPTATAWSAPPRCRWRRCTWTSSSRRRAAAALRRLLDLLPPRGRRRRQGHARHLPRAPVRQGRDVLVLPARAGRVEHELILATEEDILQLLGIPYRVVNIAAGDLGAPAAKKYDCEAWMPGQGRYREVTSCSNCTDYQARRLNCRYRTDKGPRFVHTLNGTGRRLGARSSRSWRTTSAPTGRSRCRRCCARTSARRRWAAEAAGGPRTRPRRARQSTGSASPNAAPPPFSRQGIR